MTLSRTWTGLKKPNNKVNFNMAALAIVPLSAINAYTLEQQIDAIYDVADDPTTESERAKRLAKLAGKLLKRS